MFASVLTCPTGDGWYRLHLQQRPEQVNNHFNPSDRRGLVSVLRYISLLLASALVSDHTIFTRMHCKFEQTSNQLSNPFVCIGFDDLATEVDPRSSVRSPDKPLAGPNMTAAWQTLPR